MNRINQYLLTHYPLLWNTRVVWVLAANLLLHLLFFFGGLVTLSAQTLQYHSSVWNVGGAGLYMMAVLCSAVMIVGWCIFYLRNNAFKSFYRIGRWYLAKEFVIIFFVLLTSVSYPVSFQQGVKLRIRSITNAQEMVAEMNVVNRGMVYVPTARENYFALNDCEGRRLKKLADEKNVLAAPQADFETTITDTVATPNTIAEPTDTVIAGVKLDSARARQVLQRPDAYSFLHYCTNFVSSSHYTIDSAEAISANNRQWLRAGNQKAVQQSISQLFDILSKYGIKHELKADSLTRAVFTDEWFRVSRRVPDIDDGYSSQYVDGIYTANNLRAYDLSSVFNLIEDAQPKASNYTETASVIGYISLSLSVLLLCYRRFSKRVFLISIVGSLLWAILIGLMGVGGGSDTSIPVLLLLLCAVFGAVAWMLTRKQGNKTAAGVLLCWHAYLLPFVAMLLVWIIDKYLDGQRSGYYNYPNEFAEKNFPISWWVSHHEVLIFLVYIPVAVVYLAFVFNGLAKRWQAMPEE